MDLMYSNGWFILNTPVFANVKIIQKQSVKVYVNNELLEIFQVTCITSRTAEIADLRICIKFIYIPWTCGGSKRYKLFALGSRESLGALYNITPNAPCVKSQVWFENFSN